LLFILLIGARQLSEMVSITQGMEKFITIIRLPVIMAENTVKVRQYVSFIHRLFPPSSMRKIMCPFLIGCAM